MHLEIEFETEIVGELEDFAQLDKDFESWERTTHTEEGDPLGSQFEKLSQRFASTELKVKSSETKMELCTCQLSKAGFEYPDNFDADSEYGDQVNT